MKPALVTGAAAAFTYLCVTFINVTREYHRELATRRAWNHYRSTH